MSDQGTELFYAAALANVRVRLALQSHMKDMEFTSELAERITHFFLEESRVLRPYKPIELQAELIQDFEPEVTNVLIRCNDFAIISEHDALQTVVSGFQSFYNSRKVTEVLKENRHDPTAIIEKMAEIRGVSLSTLPAYRLGKLNPSDTRKEDFGDEGELLPTSSETIRRACPRGKYYRDQLICVVARPGAGKSLFLANEVAGILKAGYTVFWASLGDLNRTDHIVRMTSIIKRVGLTDVELNTEHYFDDSIRKITENLILSPIDAGAIDAYQLRNFLETQIAHTDNVDCVVVDYDSNLSRGTDGFDSLYAFGEETYNVVASMKRPVGKKRRLVFIASQPKAEWWEMDKIPLVGAAESTRKQGIIDGMVTIGRDPSIVGDPGGIISLPKWRRGVPDQEDFYIRRKDGTFELIDEEFYYRMERRYPEKKPKKKYY